MDEKQNLEDRLLSEQSKPKIDVEIEIERTINAIEEGLSNEINTALFLIFPSELRSLILGYTKLSKEQKKKLISKRVCRINTRQTVCGFTIAGGALAFFAGLSTIVTLFAQNPCHKVITADASWSNTCWKQKDFLCCDGYYIDVDLLYGDNTIFPDPKPGTQLPLGDAISKLLQDGACDTSDICPEFIDCSEVDKTSPSYYKNFNPCARPNNVKPSPLTRKIAMARDKQLKSKQHKK